MQLYVPFKNRSVPTILRLLNVPYIIFISLLTGALVATGFAQQGESLLSGRVLDPSGAVIQGASVTLSLPDGSTRLVTSDEAGMFQFESLREGEYDLRIEADDFRTAQEIIDVPAGERVVIDQNLELDPNLILQRRVMVVGSPSETNTIPGSAHYLSGDQLERQKFSFDDIQKLLAPIPGVNIQEEEGFGLRPNIGMRGTGVERSSKITIMEDGVLIAPAPYAAPSAYYFPTAGRMEAIEVRKGSSQVKFGPQTNGGVLNLISTSIPDSFQVAGTITGGTHGTGKGHIRIGDAYDQFGWLFETYQIGSKGFKELDGGGDTGFRIKDYVGKFRFNSSSGSRVYQAFEVKLGKTDQKSDETYFGLTNADFSLNPKRRYAASQHDVFRGNHEQYQFRYFVGLGNADITVTAYRNDFARNWYKLGTISKAKISKVLGTPEKYSKELAIAKGGNSDAGALRVRANNREYFSTGFQSTLGLRAESYGLKQSFEFGMRYHVDQEARLQHEDAFQMSGGRMTLTKPGPPGSQANRVSEGRSWAFFAEDVLQFGKWRLSPGVRYERIELIRNDYCKCPTRTTPTKVKRNNLDVIIPSVGLVFQVNDSVGVFGGLNKGFGPPGPGSTEETEAETSINYEGGFRWTRGSGRFELVGFFNDYNNLLGKDTLSVGGEGTGEMYNGGETRVIGLEVSTGFDLGEGIGSDVSLPFRMAYTFTDGQFQGSFISKYGPWGTVSFGDKLPYLPAHNLNAGLTVIQRSFSFDLSTNYMSRMRVKAGSGAITAQNGTDSRFLVNLTGEYNVSEGAKLFLGVQNLTDVTYIAALRPAGVRPGLPRTLMGGLKFDIGR